MCRGRGRRVCRGGRGGADGCVGGGADGCVGVEGRGRRVCRGGGGGADGCVGVEGEGHMGVWRRGGAYEYNRNEIDGMKWHTVRMCGEGPLDTCAYDADSPLSARGLFGVAWCQKMAILSHHRHPSHPF